MEKIKLVVRPARQLPEHIARKPHFTIIFGGHSISPSCFKPDLPKDELEENHVEVFND